MLLACLAPSAWLAWKFRDLPHLGYYHDDSVYWATAKSVAQGSGYRIPSLPDRPYQTKYPPVFPLLLAGVWKLDPAFPGNLRWAMLLAWLMLPPFVLVSRASLRDLGLSPSLSWLLAAAIALSPVVAQLSINLMADLLSGALLLLSLRLICRAGEPHRSGSTAFAAGMVGGLSYLVRAAALPLLAAGPLWFLLRRQYRRAAWFGAAMGLPVVAWTLWTRTHLAPSTDLTHIYYTDYFAYQLANFSWDTLLPTLSKNAAFLITGIAQLLTSQVGVSVAGDFYWRLFALAGLAGAVRMARTRGLSPDHLFGAALIPLLLACVWPPEARSVLPLFPLLAAGLATEVGHLAGLVRLTWQRPARAGRALAGLIAAGLVLSGGLVAYHTARVLFGVLPETLTERRQLLAARRDAYHWVNHHLPPGAALMAYDDVLLYLYTGHPAIRETSPGRHVAVDRYARDRGIRYLFTAEGDCFPSNVPPLERARIQRAVAANYAGRRIYQNPLAAVYDLAR